jgi:hypothetical protein
VSDPLRIAEEANDRLRALGSYSFWGFSRFNLNSLDRCLSSDCMLLSFEMQNPTENSELKHRRLLVSPYYKVKYLLNLSCPSEEINEIMKYETQKGIIIEPRAKTLSINFKL